MPVNYQQLFTYLSHQVDESIREIEEAMDRESCGKEELMSVGIRLRGAMLTVDEMQNSAE
jgi:uncharacterized protein with GYD domain